MSTRPYLILTLRRTGGTSLTSFMQDVSDFPRLQHEPLNPDRVWGDIARSFAADEQQEALRAALAARLEQRPNIKHCFEIVAPRITQALIEACAERDYGIFLLTRANEASRLQSLFLAQATGAWGPREAARIYPRILSGEVRLDPVDLQAVRRRHARDASMLGHVLRMLRHRRIPYHWLLFEEVYARDGEIAGRVCDIAMQIGVQIDHDDDRLINFAQTSGQVSADILPYLPNRDAFESLLEELCVG